MFSERNVPMYSLQVTLARYCGYCAMLTALGCTMHSIVSGRRAESQTVPCVNWHDVWPACTHSAVAILPFFFVRSQRASYFLYMRIPLELHGTSSSMEFRNLKFRIIDHTHKPFNTMTDLVRVCLIAWSQSVDCD